MIPVFVDAARSLEIPLPTAERAGVVRIGDVLVEIDARPAGDLTPVQLRDLLSADGSTRRLVFNRDSQLVTIVLRLKARI